MPEPGTIDYSYVPRLIGVGPPLDTIKSGKVYELIALGRDEVGTLSKLNGILNAHNLRTSTAGGYAIPEPGKFVWSGFADYSESGFNVEETLQEIRRLSFVTHAEASKITDVVFDRFLFPVTILGKQRVIVVRAEPFVGVEQRLIAAFGSGGASILFDEGRNYAIESFAQYEKMLPGATPDVLLRNAIAGLRATGWGLFEVDVSRLVLEGFARVSIRQPPFSTVPGLKESFFLNGLACGALEAIFHAKSRVETYKYDEAASTLHMVLRVMR